MPADTTVARLKFDTTVSNAGLRAGMVQARQIVESGVGQIGAALSKFGGFGGIGGAIGGFSSKMGLSMPGQLGGLMGGFASPGAMGLAGGAAGIFALMQENASFARNLRLSSESMGVTTLEYQELSRAAKQSGLSIDETAGGLRRLQNAIYQANKGNKGLTDTFKRLGLSSQQLSNLSGGEQLEAIAKGLAKISNVTERRGLETEVFGREGAAMDPMLMRIGQGKGGLGAFRSWHDLRASDTKILEEQHLALHVDTPAAIRQVQARAGRAINQVGAEIGGWFHGHVGGGAEYLEELDQMDKKKGVASATGSPIDNALHGFGGMAMQGSQEAYLMNMMSRFGVTEGRDEQLDVLKEIRDKLPHPEDRAHTWDNWKNLI